MKANSGLLSALLVTGSLAVLGLSTGISDSKACRSVFWEAESAAEMLKPFEILFDSEASSARFVDILPGDGKMSYQLSLEESGRYTLWGRGRWINGCHDSIMVTIDDEDRSILGNDANYSVWHWIKGATYELEKGYHHIVVEDVERAAQIDCFLLTTFTNDNISEIVASLPSEDETLNFNDDFFAGWERNWVVRSGRWVMEDENRLHYLTQKEPGFSIITSGERWWRDLAFQAAVRLVPTGLSGLAYCYKDSDNYYMTRLVAESSATIVQTVRVLDGEEYLLNEGLLGLQDYKPHHWYQLRIEVLGGEARVFMNGTQVHAVDDDAFGRGMIGLLTNRTTDGSFDDITVESINTLSHSFPVGRGTTLVKLGEDRFNTDNMHLAPGNPKDSKSHSQDNSGINSRSNRENLLIQNHVIYGPFEIGVDATIAPAADLSIHFLDADAPTSRSWRFKVTRRRDSRLVRLMSRERTVKKIEVPGSRDEIGINIKEDSDGISFALNGTAICENIKPPWRGSRIRMGIEFEPGMVSIVSLRTSEIPFYYYNAWCAPVGWLVHHGRIAMGHGVIYAESSLVGETLLWNENHFDDRDTTFEAILEFDGSTPKGGFLEMITCNRGTEDINGYRLRFEIADSATDAIRRRILLKLFNNGRLVARNSTWLHIGKNRPVFMRPVMTMRKKSRLIVISVDHKNVTRFRDPRPLSGSRLGFVFPRSRSDTIVDKSQPTSSRVISHEPPIGIYQVRIYQ